MRTSLSNFLLSAGFGALAVAIALAHRSPATGYEPSLYAGTPASTWLCLGIALTIAIATALSLRGLHQVIGIALGALAITTVVSLPAIRGYYFMGKGDGLTHLGWVRDFLSGGMAPHELFYPGLHSVASMLTLVAGFEVPRALLVAVVLLFVPFVLFVPLLVYAVTDSSRAAGVAAVLAWFVLPVNNVGTHMGAHSNTNALFFVPVFLFAVLSYLDRRGSSRLPFGVSQYGALIVVAGTGLLLMHPQQMANAILVLATISAIQYLARDRLDDHPILEQPTTYAYTAVLAAAFGLWVLGNERFRESVFGLIYGIFTADIGGDETVGQRSASLTEIGGSLPELFVKLFLVSALVGLVAACYLLVVWAGQSRATPEARTAVTYLGAALVPLGGVFVLYFLGTSTMAFRQVGFIAVILTIIAAIALAGFVGWSGRYVPVGIPNAVVSVALGACLVLAVLTVFGSPFIYNPTQHVTEQTYHGYETSITEGADQPYAGYGYTTYRYNHAIYGVESMNASQAGIVGSGTGVLRMEEFNDREYRFAYDAEEDYFLAVSEFDTVREHELYRGLNYDPRALEEMESYHGSAKYVSNGEFTLYEIGAGSDRYQGPDA